MRFLVAFGVLLGAFLSDAVQHITIGSHGIVGGRTAMTVDERAEQQVAQDEQADQQADQQTDQVPGGLRVVVVGGGVAGLTAARTLLDNWPATAGPLSVMVLEAGNRTGGRTFSNRAMPGWGSISGAEADFGASWIHGSCPEHPITRIKDVLGLEGFVTLDSLDEVHRCRGAEHSACPELDNSGYNDYKALLMAAKDVAKAAPEDISIWDALTGITIGGGRDDPLMQYHMANALEFSVGTSPRTLSGKYYSNDMKYKGKEMLLLGGFSQVPDALIAGSFQVSASCRNNVAPDVQAVPPEARATLTVQAGKLVSSVTLSADGKKVTVGTRSGETLDADHVVVAVPLGVLKAGAITFAPALPVPTQSAISRIGFGNVLKVGLLFSSQFWGPGKHYYGFVKPQPGLPGAEKFGYFLNAGAAAKRPILFTFAFGSSATEVEAWSDEQIWAGVRESLVAVFGEANVASAQLVGMWRSRWGTDPLFQGAYSYGAIGSLPTDWAELGRATMGNRLHFAGEHVSMDYRGTVHGAFLTGQRAACEVFDETAVLPLRST